MDLATQAQNLGQAGQAGTHGEPVAVAWQQGAVVAVVGKGVRTRADQRHVAYEDIDQLRQLIQAGGANKGADAGDALVVLGGVRDLVAVLGHRHAAELEDREDLAVQAGAALAEQNRSPTFEDNRQGDHQKGRQKG